MASPLVLISSMATRAILAEALPLISAQTGVATTLLAMGGVDAATKVRQGEAVDIVLLAHGTMKKLADEGIVEARSLTPFVKSAIAFAVPESAPKPDLSSIEAVRQAMLAARAVGFSTGPSGDHVKALWQAWGIADVMAGRAVQAPPGVPVARLVAEGKADLGIQQVSELMGQPGITMVQELPEGVQFITTFTGGIATSSHRKGEAAQVLAALAAPAMDAMKHRHGMSAP